MKDSLHLSSKSHQMSSACFKMMVLHLSCSQVAGVLPSEETLNMGSELKM